MFVHRVETDEIKAVILGTETVRSALINFARTIIFTAAPGFPVVAAARSSYRLMATGQTEQVSCLTQIYTVFEFKAKSGRLTQS